MILEHDASKLDHSVVAEPIAPDQSPEAGDESSASLETPSYWKGVQECERLLEAVWPGTVPYAHDIPRQFGRFTIVRELGRGGFGIVFLAFDTVLRRQVALKLPRPEVMVTPDFRRRFLREAEAASRLDHPHIVPVYEVGEEGPICYIASAYCEGSTLAAWLRSQPGPVPVLVAARLVAILSAAVAHAHERSILHRDIKPSNILLQESVPTASTSERTCPVLTHHPRICDFGLAKLLDQTSQETCTGVPIGSASYMAPEQAGGRLREQGPATDVYALGVILYELLTGRPPFRGETDLETIRLVSDRDPPAPRVQRPDLPRDLATITLKCLEKRPIDRYASATELTEELESFLDGKPIRARPAPVWERLRMWGKRRPEYATLALATLLAVASIGGVFMWSGAWLRWHQEDKAQAVSLAERDAHQQERSAFEARIAQSGALQSERSSELADRSGFNQRVRIIHETLESGAYPVSAIMMESFRASSDHGSPDGFPRRYLHGLFEPAMSQLGPTRIGAPAVVKLATSPDSRFLAAGVGDGRVEIWDLATERLRHTLIHRNDPRTEPYLIQFSPDGRYIATVVPPDSAKIWDARTFEELATLPRKVEDGKPHGDDVFTLRFTDNSDYLATFVKGPEYGGFEVFFWDLPAPGRRLQHRATVMRHQIPSFGREGPLKGLSSGRADESTAPWLAYTKNHLNMLDDGLTLAIADGMGATVLYEHHHHTPVARIHKTLKIPAIQQRPFGGLSANDKELFGRQASRVAGSVARQGLMSNRAFDVVTFSPDGRSAAAHMGGLELAPLGVALIDVASSRVMLTNAPARWRVVDIAFTPDGRTLAIAGFDARIQLWRLGRNALAGHDKEIWSLAFSPDDKSLVSGADDSTAKIWDIASGRERATLKGHQSLVTSVAYSPDGKLVASASFDKTIRLWDAVTGELKGTLRGHTGRVRSLAFSPDGKILASAGHDRSIRLWEIETGSEVHAPLVGHTDTVFALAFAPDGKTLYSGATDKTIRLWDPAQGRQRAVWHAADQVYALAISPDGDTLAAAHLKGPLVLWNVASAKARPPLKGHDGDVLGVAFSPDGRTVASAGRDRTVRLWDPVTSEEVLTLRGHQEAVHAVAFSHDGTVLASGSHDGAIKLWRAPRSARQ